MNKQRRSLLAAGLALGASTRAFANTAGVGTKEIVIGQSAILSGPLGIPVLAFNAGANLHLSAINAAGGVNGRSLRLVSLDDGLNPATAVANYKRLLSQAGAFALFGAVGSATTTAAAPVLEESGAPLIGNFALSDSARQSVRGGAYFVRATYRREAEVLVEHLATIGLSRIGIAVLANQARASWNSST